MRIVYHVLGAVAKCDATLARYRLNFIPSNFLLLAVLAYWAFSLGSNAVDALTNAPTPMAVSLRHLDDSGAVRQHHIRVSGDLMPSVLYRHENDSRTDWWSPLIDRASGRAILVKR